VVLQPVDEGDVPKLKALLRVLVPKIVVESRSTIRPFVRLPLVSNWPTGPTQLTIIRTMDKWIAGNTLCRHSRLAAGCPYTVKEKHARR
jgi:hypothetical protein